MEEILQFVIGLALVTLLGLGVPPLLERVKKGMKLAPPNNSVREEWKQLTGGNEGGCILGVLERWLFFAVFWINEPTAIAVWLAFKVASKWDAWKNVIAIPEKMDGATEWEFLTARRKWGSQMYATFLIGTLANVLIGMLGVYAVRHGYRLAVCGFC